MEKYHINYEGKILPCRAKVKKCPYEPGRHGNSYEELYPIVMEYYNNAPENKTLLDELKAGEPLPDFSSISDQLETTNAPMETMIATLGIALQNINAGDMPKEYKTMKDKSVKSAYELYRMGTTPPRYLPKSFNEDAYRQWIADGSPRIYAKVGENTGETYQNLVRDIEFYKDSYGEFEAWERTHLPLTPEEKREYKIGLLSDFNHYSKVLNTSKLVTRPDWEDNKSVSAINSNLEEMSDNELLSIYDDLSISDIEVRRNLHEINNFTYKRRNDISDKANDNIENWYARNRKLAQKAVLRSSNKILLGLRVAKELMARDVQFGDTIRAMDEKK